MAPFPPGWPEPWRLTAPESYVLLQGDGESAEPLKLALMELVSRGALAIGDFEFRGSAGGVDVGLNVQSGNKVIRSGPNADTPVEPPLASILRIYQPMATLAFQGQVGVAEFMRQARSAFGSIEGYISREVFPALIDRGLYERKKSKLLWLIPVTRTVLTPAGQTARAELQQWVMLGQESFGPWADGDPRMAMAFLGAAGAAVLLVPPVYSRLSGFHDSVEAADGITWDDSAIALDPSSFDSLDTSFDTVSSSVDATTNDSGSGSGSDSGATSSSDSSSSDSSSSDSSSSSSD